MQPPAAATPGEPRGPAPCASAGQQQQEPPWLLQELGAFVARALFCLAPVYLAGSLGLSSSWVLAGLVLWMWWRRNRRGKRARLSAALGRLAEEEAAAARRRSVALQHLPAGVLSPDVERVEWLNKVLVQAWPYFGTVMEKTLKEKIEPKIRAKNVHLKTCTFSRIHFGEKCPKINGVKTYTKETDSRQVVLDLQISYIGDCEIHMEVSKLKGGVKGIQLHGTLRVILEPLITDVPFFGALTMFFVQKPHLEVNWAGLTNLLDAPGISSMSDTIIQDLIAARLVLPNRITIPLKKNMKISHLRFPVPYGVVRVHLLEAENLVQKDHFRGKSDPYAILRVGLVQFRSKTIQRNLNPIWNEMSEFVVHEVPGQDLEVDLYDEDPDKDDFLGSLLINLADVMNDRIVDEWFPLSKTASGHLHLKLEWLSLVTDQEKLHEDKNGLATALLIVYLDSAFNLPKNHFEYSNGEYGAKKLNQKYLKKMDRDPSSYVQLTVGNKIQKSKTCNFSKDPVWGQAFTFFVHSAQSQSLHLEIKDKDQENALGTLVVSLSHLLKDSEMTLDQKFQLDHSGLDSFIKMKLVLRVLCIKEPDPQSNYTSVNALKQVPLLAAEKGGNQCKNPLPSKPEPSKMPHVSKDSGVPESKEAKKESNADLTGSENPAGPTINETITELNAPAGAQNLETQPLESLPTRTLEHNAAPSVASLGSHASSCFELDHSYPNLLNGTNLTAVLLGEIQLTVRYASLRQSLIVTVNSCRNLMPASNRGVDPYVRVYLLPDKRWASRKKTTVKKKTLNPHYDEKFEFFESLEEVKKRTLDVAVKNSMPFISRERRELGKVLIDLSKEDLIKGFSQWYELIAKRRSRR
ncbi:extended synaptotagmin-3 isoform X1 [Dermochelys coriacea]|uniref:extended synaptotagmin-3 isoform X1 n=1 Tax=Dermochelys coriacea TaxID=27794 RepID=UPI0018E88575|nr:extended synaptotagmin-3 isoform X1 [Dermochelys coriacea]XP_038276875.1 extended synaptotagmin-3 isoform X1 [Dermochelys coriacea]